MMRPTFFALGLGFASAAPCDVYAAAGTPCVGAFSPVRALFDAYAGPLYVVRRASDNTTRAVSTLAAGGFVDSRAQDVFCAGTSCAIWRLVDQSRSFFATTIDRAHKRGPY